MIPGSMELTTTVVQVLKGGDPEDDECAVCLDDVRNPAALSYCGPSCACGRTGVLYPLWDELQHYRLFGRDADTWLRVCSPEEAADLPEGASLVVERTVMVGVG